MVTRLLLLLALLAIPARAAHQIEITAHFADLPAGADVPATPDKLARTKSATLLSSPRITVAENVEGTVEIAQDTRVPGGGQVSLGVTLTIKTSITERGSIWFSGNLRDRSRGGGEKTERLETAGFATREWYFSGYTSDGGTVVIRTVPATSKVVKDGKTISSSRELVAYLKLDKKSVKAAPKKTSTTTKKTPSSSSAPKAGLRKRR